MLTTEIKNQTHCLTDDVEKWLKHNKPTLLAHGESLGEVKAITKPVVKVSPVEQKRAIRAQAKIAHEIDLEKRRQQARALRKSKIHEQAIVIEPFYDKARRKDIGVLCEMVGITSVDLRCALESRLLADGVLDKIKAALVDFKWFVPTQINKKTKEKTDEQKGRYKAVSAAKKKASAEGKTRFMAPCRIHGMTDYSLSCNRVQCILCSKRKILEHKSQNDGERRRLNAARMKTAIQAGLVFFTGTCLHHGDTTYSMRKRYKNSENLTYVCSHCDRITIEKSNAIQREKRKMRKLK